MIQGVLLRAIVSAALLLATGRAATADDVLTCARFKERLDETIAAMGDRVARPGPLRPAYDGGDSDKRFDWDGIVGLSGTMTCAKSDAFEDFAISIPEAYRMSDDLPVALKRFMELAATSVCALADTTPEACRALVTSMTADSLARFKEAVAKGETMPIGTRDFFIVKGIDAELDMTPVGISWSIGPGLASTTGVTRQNLDPKNADE